MSDQQQNTARIRELNDQFRMNGGGCGSIFLTQGIQALDETAIARVLCAIRVFDRFGTENDPWEEHDFGSLQIERQKIFWKIDYYDQTLQYLSPDPADPAVTHRTLTIMLADEY